MNDYFTRCTFWTDDELRAHVPSPPPEFETKLPSPEDIKAQFRDIVLESRLESCRGAPSYIALRPAMEHGVVPSLWSQNTMARVSLQKVAQRMNHIHSDSVLFVKTVQKAIRLVALQTLVQDDNGDVVGCSLKHLGRTGDEDPNDLLPKGSFLAILQPLLVEEQDFPGCTPTIRCDNPQCLVVFDTEAAWEAAKNGDPCPSEQMDPRELRLEGNKAFQKGALQKSIRYYSRALKVDTIEEGEAVTCLSNRAAAYLLSEQWEFAEVDARKVLILTGGSHVKARYRLANALLRLNNVEEALSVATALCRENPKEKLFQSLHKVCLRCQQEKAGEYDIPQMYQDLSLPLQKRRFHANFLSGSVELGVEIRSASDSKTYRGSRAKTTLKEGELILSCKATLFKEFPEVRPSRIPYVEGYYAGDEQIFLFEATSLITHRPAMGAKFYDLYAGHDYPFPPSTQEQTSVDLGRMRNILSCNSIRVKNIVDATIRDLAGVDAVTPALAGFWLDFSYFNNSCVTNCVWSHVGDHLFVHASRPIASGEELCVAYHNPWLSHTEKENEFKNYVGRGDGFACRCERCELLRQNSKLLEMEKVIGSVSHYLEDYDPFVDVEMVLSKGNRQRILDAHAHLPLQLQHSTVFHVHNVNYVESMMRDKPKRALASRRKCGDICKAVHGTFNSLNYAILAWTVAQVAVECGKKRVAVQYLEEMFRSCYCLVPVDIIKRRVLPRFLATTDFGEREILENLSLQILDERDKTSN